MRIRFVLLIGGLFFVLFLPVVLLEFHSSKFFLTHDGPYHIERTFNYLESLSEGNYLPTWTRRYNSDFGSPILIFLFPVVYWVNSLWTVLKLDLVAGLKLSFVFWQMVAAVGMYVWLRKSLGFRRAASIIGAALFIYAPINIAQVFVRGSLREFAAVAVLPWVLVSIKRLWGDPRARRIVVTALTLGLFLLIDGITLLVLSPILVGYIFSLLWTSKNRSRFLVFLAVAIGLAGMLASFIYLPFLAEIKFLKGSVFDYRDHFVYFGQLFDPHWGFGFSVSGPHDQLSFQVGIISLIALLSYGFCVWTRKLKPGLLSSVLLVCLAGYLFLALENPVTQFVWQHIKLLQLVQLPWRFLIGTSFVFAFLGARAANSVKLAPKWSIAVCVMILAISVRYLRTNVAVEFNQNYLSNNSGDATAYHEFIPIWRDSTSGFSGFSDKIELVDGVGSLTNISEKNRSLEFNTSSVGGMTLRVNTLYFPGWQIQVDGHLAPLTITKNESRPLTDKRDLSGLMQVFIPSGNHRVVLSFEETPDRAWGKILSLTGGVIIIGLGLI